MQVNKLTRNNVIKNHTEEAYQRLQDHVTFLKEFLSVVEVKPVVAQKYIGDFYGLMDELDVDWKYHHINLIMNGYDNPQDYHGLPVVVIVDNVNDVDRILNS